MTAFYLFVVFTEQTNVKIKFFYLEQFLDSFEVVKLEVRLCKDLKLISIKQQAELALLMENIGKQITGWRNAQK